MKKAFKLLNVGFLTIALIFSFVIFDNNAQAASYSTRYINSTTYVYNGTSKHKKHIHTFYVNDKVKVKSASKDMDRISFGKKYGYIYKSKVSKSLKAVYIKNYDVWLYKPMNKKMTDFEEVYHVKIGSKFSPKDSSDDLYIVSYKGKKLYLFRSDTTTDKKSIHYARSLWKTQTFYVNKSNANMDINGATAKVLYGEKLKITYNIDKDNPTYSFKYAGMSANISSNYVSTKKPSSTSIKNNNKVLSFNSTVATNGQLLYVSTPVMRVKSGLGSEAIFEERAQINVKSTSILSLNNFTFYDGQYRMDPIVDNDYHSGFGIDYTQNYKSQGYLYYELYGHTTLKFYVNINGKTLEFDGPSPFSSNV